MAEQRISHPTPDSQALALRKLFEAEPVIEIVPASRPDFAGFEQYLSTASADGLGNLELKWLGEESTVRQELSELSIEIFTHGFEAGRINHARRGVSELYREMGEARARVMLCQSETARRKSGLTFAKPAKPRRRPLIDFSERLAHEAAFRKAQADAEAADPAGMDYVQQHHKLIYYEQYGCRSCHKWNGPHAAHGYCHACYMLIRQREQAILAGRKVRIHKPAARFRASSPFPLLAPPETPA
jgi:hypothetical protein